MNSTQALYSLNDQIHLESQSFSDYQFLTVPLGLIGLLSIIRYATKSTSSLLTLCAFYILSLIPVVSIGVLLGTLLFSAAIVGVASFLELNLVISLFLAAIGCVFQNLNLFANASSGSTFFTAEVRFLNFYTRKHNLLYANIYTVQAMGDANH